MGNARALMVAGTASHVGKSWMATAVCRYLRNKGMRVAPFKAQNMSNNSFPCAGGGEIGRAQVAQAQACGLEPTPEMNPILLKPTSDRRSQVVVHGKVWKTLDAACYYEEFEYLLAQVLEAYHRLLRQYDFLVIEGAGSITELNLKHRDLVNLGLATRVDAPVMLVADIDRGGVFASLVGTFALLEPQERALVRGFAVNRFRGDPQLFANGRQMLEQHTQHPCLGVFSYDASILLDAEDGVGIPREWSADAEVAIIHLPHISNTTDFRLLRGAAWITQSVDRQFKAIVLPGTKNTIDDLAWMKRTGLADWVKQQHKNGATVMGICGGYQMLGETVEDPSGVESMRRQIDGLGLLPCRTRLSKEKVTRRVDAVTNVGTAFSAYEIHMGITTVEPNVNSFARLSDGSEDGAMFNRCIGTYLHGALENVAVVREVLGIEIREGPPREHDYERLAHWFASHVDERKFEALYLCA
jgi:adenosylcobyric acid synthase